MSIMPSGSNLSPHTEQQATTANLRRRILTAALLAPVALFGVFVGGWLFAFGCAAITAIGAAEFYSLEARREAQGSAVIGIPAALMVILAFQLRNNALWITALLACAILVFLLESIRQPGDIRRTLLQTLMTLFGVLYVAFPIGFLVQIRALPEGLYWMLVIFAVTWGTDTFSYIGGRLFGRNKLAPHLSPKKTVEGAVVGILAGAGFGILFLVAGNLFSQASLALVILGPLVAIAGDLFESALKRSFQVKDSGIRGLDIFPGHGGVLDRIDSLLAVSALVFFYLLLFR